jgi:uncharacterized membrane protein
VGSKIEISADALASKTFFMAILGALLYVAVVFAFVIGGNRPEDELIQPPPHHTAEGHTP